MTSAGQPKQIKHIEQPSQHQTLISGAWRPQREPVFRALWIAAVASNVGTWMEDVGAGRTTPWILLSLAFALGVGAAANAPAWEAITPELVSRSDLPAAVTLGAVAFNVARAIGPALGGLLVAAFGSTREW